MVFRFPDLRTVYLLFLDIVLVLLLKFLCAFICVWTFFPCHLIRIQESRFIISRNFDRSGTVSILIFFLKRWIKIVFSLFDNKDLLVFVIRGQFSQSSWKKLENIFFRGKLGWAQEFIGTSIRVQQMSIPGRGLILEFKFWYLKYIQYFLKNIYNIF